MNTSPHPKTNSSQFSARPGQANAQHGGQAVGIPSQQILTPTLTINLTQTDNKLIIGECCGKTML